MIPISGLTSDSISKVNSKNPADINISHISVTAKRFGDSFPIGAPYYYLEGVVLDLWELIFSYDSKTPFRVMYICKWFYNKWWDLQSHSINLYSFRGTFRDKHLSNLISNCYTEKVIRVKLNANWGLTNIHQLKYLTNLKVLNVEDSLKIVVNEHNSPLNYLKTLDVLNLKRTTISDEVVDSLKSLEKLRVLNIDCCKGISIDKELPILNVEEIHLGGSFLTEKTLNVLSSFPNLSRLYLTAPTVSDISPYLKPLCFLKTLSIKLYPIIDPTFKIISSMTSLTELYLTDCLKVTFDSYLLLAKLKNLSHLHLSHCANFACSGGFSGGEDKSITKIFENLKQLEHIRLDHSNINGATMKAIERVSSYLSWYIPKKYK